MESEPAELGPRLALSLDMLRVSGSWSLLPARGTEGASPPLSAPPRIPWGPSSGAASPRAPIAAPDSAYSPGLRDTRGWSVGVGAGSRAHEPYLDAGAQLLEALVPGLPERLTATLTPDAALAARVAELDEALRGELLRPPSRADDAQLKNARLLELAAARYEAWLDAVEHSAARRRACLPHAARALFRLQRRAGPGSRAAADDVPIAVSRARGRDEVQRGLRAGFRLLGAAAPRDFEVVQRRARARYDPSRRQLDVGPEPAVCTVLHELGHAAEAERPAWAEAARAWRAARNHAAGLADLRLPLDALYPDVGYGPDEIVAPDHFVDPYVGKLYPSGATEVVSVGLEHLASADAFVALYERDPEHAHLVLGCLAEAS